MIKISIFLSHGEVKSKVTIAARYIINGQSNFVHRTADRLDTIL
jgi:hypothetical protein